VFLIVQEAVMTARWALVALMVALGKVQHSEGEGR